jgi:hypothetical protein
VPEFDLDLEGALPQSPVDPWKEYTKPGGEYELWLASGLPF